MHFCHGCSWKFWGFTAPGGRKEHKNESAKAHQELLLFLSPCSLVSSCSTEYLYPYFSQSQHRSLVSAFSSLSIKGCSAVCGSPSTHPKLLRLCSVSCSLRLSPCIVSLPPGHPTDGALLIQQDVRAQLVSRLGPALRLPSPVLFHILVKPEVLPGPTCGMGSRKDPS